MSFSTRPPVLRTTATVLLMLATPFALAHTGADDSEHHSFITGLLHPLMGIDHLAAMLSIGLWSALSAPALDRRLLTAPVSFVLMLLCGALLGYAGVSVGMNTVEPMIAASVLVIGLLAATRQAMPTGAAVALVGLFAVFHGLAHGAELSLHQGGAAALAGMVLATGMLHALGLALGVTLRQRSLWWSRLLGAGTAIFGASLLLLPV